MVKSLVKNWKPILGGLILASPDIIETVTPLLPPRWQGGLRGLGAIILALNVKSRMVTGGSEKQ